MLGKPEEFHPALVAAFNAGDLEALFRLYDPKAVFVIKPGKITDGPTELRAALERLVSLIRLGGRIAIEPRSFTRSGDVTLVLGTYRLTGRRRDGSPLDVAGRFADILRLQPDGRWLMAVDNGLAGE
jgi:ketosteroid isomerase-like protein